MQKKLAMIKITFPDGNIKEYNEGVSGMQIAESISSRLAKEVFAISVNGTVHGLLESINEDAEILLHKFDSEEGKHVFWHTSAHIMAQALAEIFPGTKFGIGPAIENGFYYDIELPDGKLLSENDFKTIDKKMAEICQKDFSLTRAEVSKSDAEKIFANNEYKLELISELEGTISTYTQENFVDLCRGPHIPSTGAVKAIQVLSLAGAFWRGDAKRNQLTRVYGISFPKKSMLDEYLSLIEEAKKRDHRKLGKELELFTFSARVGMGLPIWLPRGTDLRKRLENFLTKVQQEAGYEQVMTPHIGNVNLYKTSGHYQKYGADSFQVIRTPEEGEEYLLKPMNCPHHCEIFAAKPHSYKDLPCRIAEFGTVYRYEQSGELHGLTRVRGFTQDDAHIFCTQEQVKEEFKGVMDIVLKIFKILDFKEYTAQISLRDRTNTEKYIGSDENWEKAEKAIIDVANESGMKTVIEYGEAAFYGPKLDFMIKDALGRKWQLGTIQVDYNLPERFELEYTGSDNQKHRPVMIHRAPFGSMERFVAVLIEHCAGKFPLWLTPDQFVILPISEKYNDYAKKVLAELKKADVRGTIDDRDEKIGKKIRDNELKKIPYLLIVGEKEEADNVISVRRQGEGDKGAMTAGDFTNLINEEINKIFNND